jgi:hypothetical protein
MTYRYTTDELRFIGNELLSTRLESLVYQESIDAAVKWTSYARALDMNIDGAVTVSDVGLWFKRLFWLPGDYAIIAAMAWVPRVAQFLEIGPGSLAGLLSGVLSAIVWLMALLATEAS